MYVVCVHVCMYVCMINTRPHKDTHVYQYISYISMYYRASLGYESFALFSGVWFKDGAAEAYAGDLSLRVAYARH